MSEGRKGFSSLVSLLARVRPNQALRPASTYAIYRMKGIYSTICSRGYRRISMNVLVTGGAGFVGSHLVEGLVRSGHRVRVMDDLSTGRRYNLRHLAPAIEWIEDTVLDPAALQHAVEGVEVVFHQAAISSVSGSVRDPAACHEANVSGTLNVLLAARDAGVRRVIYAGCSSAYGAGVGRPRDETVLPRPATTYAVTKLAGERYCQVFAQQYNLETVCLRYFSVFGPRQHGQSEHASAIPQFVAALQAGCSLTLLGDGSQLHDFVCVEDVVAANLLAMTARGVSGEVINVGSGQPTSLNELAALLGRIAGAELQIDYLPTRGGNPTHPLADISKARALLGYDPEVSLASGLRQTWAYYGTGEGQRELLTGRSIQAVRAPIGD
jgi:nucleoside-diphosphate-sugar epimerase